MFKKQLHELCQQRRWALPVYTDRREGPPHAPTFHVTLAVNGAKFHSPEAGASKLKTAKDLAAMAALYALRPPSPPPQPETEFRYGQRESHTIQIGPPQVPCINPRQELAQDVNTKKRKLMAAADDNSSAVCGSWMQQGTMNLVEQEIKIACLRPAEAEQIRALMASLDQETRASMETNRGYTKLILARIQGVINGFCTDTADNKSLRAEVNRLRHVLITEKEGFNKMKDAIIKILEELGELRRREEAWKEILGMDLSVVGDQRDKARVELDEERLTVAMLKEDITNLEKELRVQRQLNEFHAAPGVTATLPLEI